MGDLSWVDPRLRNDPLPKGYLVLVGERGYTVEWAPQLEVLSYSAVGGFWTHNVLSFG